MGEIKINYYICFIYLTAIILFLIPKQIIDYIYGTYVYRKKINIYKWIMALLTECYCCSSVMLAF